MDFPHAFRALIAAANVMTREHATNLRFTADTLDHADIDAFDAFIFIRNEILDQSLHDLNCWKLERDKLVLAIRQPSTDKQISPRQFLYSRPLIAVKNGLHSMMPLVQTCEQVGVVSNISLADDSATAVLQVCSRSSGLIIPSKAANHIFIAFTSSEVAFIFSAVASGLFNALLTPTYNSLSLKLSPKERSGAASATYWLGFDLGMAIGQVVFGMIIDTRGGNNYGLSFFVAGIYLLVFCAISFLALRKLPPLCQIET